MTFNFDFDSRDTYLAARAAWATHYNELSASIRKTRADRIQAFQGMERSWATIESLKKSGQAVDPAIGKERHAFFMAWSKADGDLIRLRRQASEELENLHAAKEEANRQWRAKCTQPV